MSLIEFVGHGDETPINTPSVTALSAIANNRVMITNNDDDVEEPIDFHGFQLTRNEIAVLNAPSSMFILSGDNTLRLKTLQLIRSPPFQNFILACIVLNSVLLGADWPAVTNPPAFDAFLEYADLVFNIIFAAEIVVKVIALGFVLHDGSFLRIGWNIMDFIIVAFSVVQLVLGNRALSGVRAVRVFRPLRSISRIPRLKHLVSALIKGLPQVLDNLILFVFVIMLFAMAGVQLFLEMMSRRCYVDAFVSTSPYFGQTPFLILNETQTCGGTHTCEILSPAEVTQQSCAVHRDVFTRADMNFDNFFSSSMLVLKIVVNDNWPDELDALTNSAGYVAVPFFILVVCIGTWYCINLFLAILTSAYSSKQENDEDEQGLNGRPVKRDRGVQADATLHEVLFREIDRIEQTVTEAGAFASHFGTFDFHPDADHPEYHRRLIGAIEMSHAKRTAGGALRFGGHQGFSYIDVFHDDPKVCETLQGAVHRPDAEVSSESDDETDEAKLASSRLEDERAPWRKKLAAFVSHPGWDAFIMLVTVANVASLSIDYYGIDETFSMALNITSLVCTGLFALDIILKVCGVGVLTYLKLGMNRLDLALVVVSVPDIIASGGDSSAFSAIRVFRLFRLIRLLRGVKSMQTLLLCVIHSLSSAALLSMLLMLFIYIYSILGMQLFGVEYNVPQTNANVRDSFGTLWEAALACFVVVTGDNWTDRIFLNNPSSVGDVAQNVIFFVSLFIIGNYVFLNLFVAILLDSLSEMMERVEQTELVMPSLILPTISNAHRLLGLPSMAPNMKKSDIVAMDNDDDELLQRVQSRKGFHDVLEEEDGMILHNLKALSSHLFGDRGIVVEGNALFIIPAGTLFRTFFVRMVSCNAFQLMIDIVLVINAGAIAVQSPLLSQETQDRLDTLNLFLTWFFVAEMTAKMIAFGVWWPAGELKKHMVTTDSCEWKIYPAYLRIGWNVVDFVVVVASVLGQLFSELQILRAFRTIRLIHRIPPMRTVVLSLLQAVPQVMNAFGLVVFLLVVFTIMGVQFFKGKFYHCNDPLIQESVNCIGFFNLAVDGAFETYNVTAARSWERLDFHFDNFGASMTSVFVVSVGDGWSSVMYNAMDTTSVGGGLKYYASPQYALFFVIMFACCNFCALQMLVGVLINYFQKMKEQNDGSAVLTPQQRMYVHARHAIEASAIVDDEAKAQPYAVSEFIHWLYTFRIHHEILGVWKPNQPVSEYISFLAVITNTIAIAYTHAEMDDKETTVLNLINLVCLVIFTVEVVLLLVAYFPQQYFSMGWNVMDFLIVCAGWLEFILPDVPGVTFLRVIRVSKLLRGTGVEKLILTTIRSYQSFLNALLMLVLVLFIYASVGVQLFGTLPYNDVLDSNNNFQTLPNAMLVLFQIITTEGWETLLLGCRGAGFVAEPYFISFMIIGCFTILQLFTAVVVDVFEQQTDESDRIVGQFLEIREQWLLTFGPTTSIPMHEFVQFLTKIPQDLTELSRNPQRVDVVHLLASLSIPITSQGLVYYHHVVNALAWRRFNIEVRTIGGVIHGIVFDKVVHQSFTIGEAFCAEILQSRWRDYIMKRRVGEREYKQLVNRTRSNSVFMMPRQRSVCSIFQKDEARRMSMLSSKEIDEEECDPRMMESADFSSGGDSAVPGNHKTRK